MTDIKSLDLQEITQLLREMGEPSFRGKQVFTWLHRGVTSFEEMSDLSKPLRQKLAERCYITVPTVERKQVSKHDGTVKYLWRLRDGNCIETVLMRYHHGNTVCISSQVGCRMGCAFCASTIAGKVRDLSPSEILDQVLFTQLDSGLTISNIVLMGIGWIQGIQQACVIFQTAILLAAAFGVCMLALGMGRKKELPFVPFLLAGYLVQYI